MIFKAMYPAIDDPISPGRRNGHLKCAIGINYLFKAVFLISSMPVIYDFSGRAPRMALRLRVW